MNPLTRFEIARRICEQKAILPLTLTEVIYDPSEPWRTAWRYIDALADEHERQDIDADHNILFQYDVVNSIEQTVCLSQIAGHAEIFLRLGRTDGGSDTFELVWLKAPDVAHCPRDCALAMLADRAIDPTVDVKDVMAVLGEHLDAKRLGELLRACGVPIPFCEIQIRKDSFLDVLLSPELFPAFTKPPSK